MSHTLTESATFTATITVPDGSDSATNRAADVEAIAQGLANRTQYLLGETDDLAYHGANMSALANMQNRSYSGYIDELQGIGFHLGSGRVWVAVGVSQILRSKDHGVTWQDVATPFGNFRAVAYGASLWVAVGGTGTSPVIFTSPDGATWTARTAGAGAVGYLAAITYAAGLFVAVGTNGERQSSPDGITWTHQTPVSTHGLASIVYDGSNFVAVGQTAASDGIALTSANGTTGWTARSYPGTAGGQTAVTVFGSSLVSVGVKKGATSTGVLCVSTDHGVTWTQSQELGLFVPLCCASVGGLVMIGTDSSSNASFGAHPAILLGKPGFTFTAVPAVSNQEGLTSSNGGTIYAIATDGQKACIAGSYGTLADSGFVI